MSDQNPYSPPPSGSSPSQDPSPYDRPAEGQAPPPPPQPYQQPGYPQPYQQPGYQQQGYPQPDYQQYPAYQQGYAGGGDERPTSTLAVVGFIVSLVGLIVPVALIGFVLSLVALPGTGRNKKKGRGFAVAGAIIGGFLTLVGIFFLVLFGAIISDVVSDFDDIDTDGDGVISNEEIEEYFSDEGNEPWWFDSAAAVEIPADPAATVVTA